MPFASKAAAQGDWWWTFRPSLPERSDNSETFVLSLDERLFNVSLARSARSSVVVLGNSINNSPILRCALFLIFRALSSASLFLSCCAYTSNARALSRSSFTSSTRWHAAIALHMASYRMRAGCGACAGFTPWMFKRSSDSRRPLLKALLNKSQSLYGNERARVGMALAAQVVVLPFDDTEAPRVNVFLIRDVVVHQEVMFTEPVK